MEDFKVQLGSLAKDLITQFEGKVTARVQYLLSPNSYFLQPEVDEDGKFVKGQWFDEAHLTGYEPVTTE